MEGKLNLENQAEVYRASRRGLFYDTALVVGATALGTAACETQKENEGAEKREIIYRAITTAGANVDPKTIIKYKDKFSQYVWANQVIAQAEHNLNKPEKSDSRLPPLDNRHNLGRIR